MGIHHRRRLLVTCLLCFLATAGHMLRAQSATYGSGNILKPIINKNGLIEYGLMPGATVHATVYNTSTDTFDPHLTIPAMQTALNNVATAAGATAGTIATSTGSIAPPSSGSISNPVVAFGIGTPQQIAAMGGNCTQSTGACTGNVIDPVTHFVTYSITLFNNYAGTSQGSELNSAPSYIESLVLHELMHGLFALMDSSILNDATNPDSYKRGTLTAPTPADISNLQARQKAGMAIVQANPPVSCTQ